MAKALSIVFLLVYTSSFFDAVQTVPVGENTDDVFQDDSLSAQLDSLLAGTLLPKEDSNKELAVSNPAAVDANKRLPSGGAYPEKSAGEADIFSSMDEIAQNTDEFPALTSPVEQDSPGPAAFNFGVFFQNFIGPMIKFGMMSSGNKTEMEINALLSVITSSVKTKKTATSGGFGATSGFPLFKRLVKRSASASGSEKATGPVFDFGDIFQNFIGPLIKHRMMTTGNKTETEATDAVNIITSSMMTKNAETSGAVGSNKGVQNFPRLVKRSAFFSTAPAFNFGEFFQNFIGPLIKHRMMTTGNKTEMEADSAVDVIISAVKKPAIEASSSGLNAGLPSLPRLKRSVETAANEESSSPAFTPKTFFETFIAPLIKQRMITAGNKTAEEADSVLDILISDISNQTAAKTASAAAGTQIEPSEKAGEDVFFQNIIAPIIRYNIIKSGNKTEDEADALLDYISGGTNPVASPSEASLNPEDIGISQPTPVQEASSPASQIDAFFQDFIGPMIKYRIMTAGNRTEMEADALVDMITSPGVESSSASASSPSSTEESEEDAFFQRFVAPMIRYNMINTGNKTETEADALMDLISAGREPAEDTAPSSFFQDFIIPMINNGVTESGSKNESETDAILDVITNALTSEENAKMSKEEDKIETLPNSLPSPTTDEIVVEAEKIVDDLIVPDMNSVINEKAMSSEADDPTKEDFESFLPEAAKEAVAGIGDNITSLIAEQVEKEIVLSEGEEPEVSMLPKSGDQEEIKTNDMLLDLTSPDAILDIEPSSKSTSNSGGGMGDGDGEANPASDVGGEFDTGDGDDSTSAKNGDDSNDAADESEEVTTVDSFIDKYLVSSISEQANRMDILATFFSNPKILNALRDSLKNTTMELINQMKASTSKTLAPTEMSTENVESFQADKSSSATSHPKSSPSDSKEDISKDPLQWFLSNLVIPGIESKMARLKTVTASLSSSDNQNQLTESIQNAISFGVSETQNPSSTDAAIRLYVTDYFVPKLTSEVKKLQDITQSASSPEGKMAILDAVTSFVNKVKLSKLELMERKKGSYDSNITRHEDNPSSSIIDDEDGELTDNFVNEFVIPALRKKAEIIKNIATKFSSPEYLKVVSDILKQKIDTAMKARNWRRCERGYCRDEDESNNAYGMSSKLEKIIRKIVELKIRIIQDRQELGELQRRIDNAVSYDDRLSLVLQKLKVVGDIKRSSIQVGHLFESLREEEGNRELAMASVQTRKSIQKETEADLYRNKVEQDLIDIKKSRDEIVNLRQRINNLNRELNTFLHYQERMKIVRDKMKLVWSLKKTGVELDQLYRELRLHQSVLKTKEREEKVQREEEEKEEENEDDKFAMDFTQEETAKYANLLGELNFAAIAKDSTEEDGNATTIATGFLIGCVAMVTFTVVAGVAYFVRRRRQGQGRKRLYTHIPSEVTLDSRSMLSPRESYGAL